ncbi:MAG: hypothetical protein JSR33_09415 [Proteobacteria bacterium]|nr:hypothetical protein [Pseudomonadota bacterium]
MLKKIIIKSTELPLIGKHINKGIILYKKYRNLKLFYHKIQTINEFHNNPVPDYYLQEYTNLLKSIPVGFRKFQLQLNELNNKLIQLEKKIAEQERVKQ